MNKLNKIRCKATEVMITHRNAVMAASVTAVLSVNTVLGADVWSKVGNMSKEIYGKIVGISTGILVLVVAIAFIMRMVSKNPRSIEMWTGWAKNAAISWVVINGLGFILTYAKDVIGTEGKVNDSVFRVP